MTQPVCISGATGFVGTYVVDAFLDAGIPVRAAVRSPDDARKTAHLVAMAERHATPLTFHKADLSQPGSYDAAIAGCEGVIHVAAVARLAAPDPQRQIVDPSIKGARNVLSSATRAGVRRVVLTSSVAAVGNYRKSEDHPLSETDWNDEATLGTDPYGYAKTQAERLAWDLASDAPWDLVVCNPAMVMGPVFTKKHSKASPTVVRDILKGAFPAIPRMCFGVVDARDVGQAHLQAYLRPEAKGRHVLCAETRWMRDVAALMNEMFPKRGIKTRQMPNLLMWLASVFDKRVDRNVLADVLDREPRYDGSHAPNALGLTYRDVDESIRDTARSMVDLGLV